MSLNTDWGCHNLLRALDMVSRSAAAAGAPRELLRQARLAPGEAQGWDAGPAGACVDLGGGLETRGPLTPPTEAGAGLLAALWPWPPTSRIGEQIPINNKFTIKRSYHTTPASGLKSGDAVGVSLWEGSCDIPLGIECSAQEEE